MQLPFMPPISSKGLSYFYRQMATMEESGIAPVAAIGTIEEQFKNPEFQAILVHIREGAQEGRTISAMMEQHPDVFSPLQCSLVHAGETGGNLAESLRRLADHLEKMVAMRDRVLLATLYPGLIFHVGVLLLALVDFFQRGAGAALLGIGLYLGALWVAVGGFYVANRKLRKKLWWDQFLRAIPWVGMVRKKLALMQFTRTLGSLMSAGVTTSLAIEQAGEASGSEVLRKIGLKTAELVEGGRGMADAFVASMIFPSMILQMIDVGEKSGRVADTMLKTSEILEDEAGHAMNIMTRVLPVAASLVVFAFLGAKIILFWLDRYSSF